MIRAELDPAEKVGLLASNRPFGGMRLQSEVVHDLISDARTPMLDVGEIRQRQPYVGQGTSPWWRMDRLPKSDVVGQHRCMTAGLRASAFRRTVLFATHPGTELSERSES